MKRIAAGMVCLLMVMPLSSCEKIEAAWKEVQAQTAYNQGDLDKAIRLYKELLERSPDDPNLHWKIGTCYFSKGDLLNLRKEILTLEHLDRSDLASHLRELMREQY